MVSRSDPQANEQVPDAMDVIFTLGSRPLQGAAFRGSSLASPLPVPRRVTSMFQIIGAGKQPKVNIFREAVELVLGTGVVMLLGVCIRLHMLYSNSLLTIRSRIVNILTLKS